MVLRGSSFVEICSRSPPPSRSRNPNAIFLGGFFEKKKIARVGLASVADSRSWSGMPSTKRRSFLKSASIAGVVAGFPGILSAKTPLLGQGDFRYRLVSGWGVLGKETPVSNCHGIVTTESGHIVLLTDEVRNNILIYDKTGKLLNKWGTKYPGAHGLSLVKEGAKEVLYITDLKTHSVEKVSLDGEVLQRWDWPQESGKYEKAGQYKPSWTLHRRDGSFFILDGYGLDFIHHYDAAGKYVGTFGGEEGGIVHWGPHGGMIDGGDKESLLIAMSDQQYLLRLDLEGKKLEQVDLPGGNPRQIRKHGEHYFLAHLGDKWPKDRSSPGFLSVLDADLRVVSNIAGTPPVYDGEGKLQTMAHRDKTFVHPHDLTVDREGSIYVAQFNSGKTYPIKLERV